MLSPFAATPTMNQKNGNGKYKTLRNRKRKKRALNNEYSGNFRYLSNNDLTMQFDGSKDPIYFAFEYLERRTLPQLMGDFIQDSFHGIAKFVSKVVR